MFNYARTHAIKLEQLVHRKNYHSIINCIIKGISSENARMLKLTGKAAELKAVVFGKEHKVVKI